MKRLVVMAIVAVMATGLAGCVKLVHNYSIQDQLTATPIPVLTPKENVSIEVQVTGKIEPITLFHTLGTGHPEPKTEEIPSLLRDNLAAELQKKGIAVDENNDSSTTIRVNILELQRINFVGIKILGQRVGHGHFSILDVDVVETKNQHGSGSQFNVRAEAPDMAPWYSSNINFALCLKEQSCVTTMAVIKEVARLIAERLTNPKFPLKASY